MKGSRWKGSGGEGMEREWKGGIIIVIIILAKSLFSKFIVTNVKLLLHIMGIKVSLRYS